MFIAFIGKNKDSFPYISGLFIINNVFFDKLILQIAVYELKGVHFIMNNLFNRQVS